MLPKETNGKPIFDREGLRAFDGIPDEHLIRLLERVNVLIRLLEGVSQTPKVYKSPENAA